MNKDFVLIGDVIKEVMEKKDLFPKTLYGAWEDIVGTETAKHSQPRRLVNGVLHVVVTDPVWKHHLELCKGEIVKKLNEFRAENPIEEIRFRIGEIKVDVPRYEKTSGKRAKKARKRRKKTVRKLCEEDRKVLKKVSDVELRKICRSLLKKVK